jgi:peptidoglycan/LPS O-acetylase OafA/YrhL
VSTLIVDASSVPSLSGGVRTFFLSLRRHTTSGLYIPELDGLRFVAILLVCIFHLAGDVQRHTGAGVSFADSLLFRLTQHGNLGVQIFFAISGMIIGLPFARYFREVGPKVSLRKYFLRRLTRLEPPYIVALLLFFVLKIVGGRGTAAELFPHLAASVAYVHNLVYSQPSSINFVAWSLEVEMQFYLAAPVLVYVFAIPGAFLRRFVICSGIVVASLLPGSQLSLAGQISYFLAGFLACELFLSWPAGQPKVRVWDTAGLAGWAALIVLILQEAGWLPIALPPLLTLLLCATLRGETSGRLFSNLYVTAIGGMCYSIYLLHNYAIALLGFVTERVGAHLPFECRLLIQMGIQFPIVLAIGIVFYRLIEQPCMKAQWPTAWTVLPASWRAHTRH